MLIKKKTLASLMFVFAISLYLYFTGRDGLANILIRFNILVTLAFIINFFIMTATSNTPPKEILSVMTAAITFEVLLVVVGLLIDKQTFPTVVNTQEIKVVSVEFKEGLYWIKINGSEFALHQNLLSEGDTFSMQTRTSLDGYLNKKYVCIDNRCLIPGDKKMYYWGS